MLSGPSGVILCYPVWFATRLQDRCIFHAEPSLTLVADSVKCPWASGLLLAEEVGFEPTEHLTMFNGFQDRRAALLNHLTELPSLELDKPDYRAQMDMGTTRNIIAL